ncbi:MULTISPECIES: hypothetical protein [unclassified Shewanella]|uniref:hypothetical protein n=1 Tax=unclassified Shewanella TaxID=196818 RepID=UPI001BBF5691|nr:MULTISPECIES: hypothetical protein [unclassified Shewanella]GIU21255.1 hypothetical protein TUM4444_40530 [Shewanella sp. MBTL60-112-B1]GIU33560.1 hypothetical protein TUM4445_20880 [Shewanella sp. MBTL60-112-B2]
MKKTYVLSIIFFLTFVLLFVCRVSYISSDETISSARSGDIAFTNLLAYGVRNPFTGKYLTKYDEPKNKDFVYLEKETNFFGEQSFEYVDSYAYKRNFSRMNAGVVAGRVVWTYPAYIFFVFSFCMLLSFLGNRMVTALIPSKRIRQWFM